jgi:hypothetical protein
MGLYKGGYIQGRLTHGRSFVLVRAANYCRTSDNVRLNLYSGRGAYIRGAYIWNEASVSTCGGLIHGGLIFGGGWAYIRRFTVV